MYVALKIFIIVRKISPPFHLILFIQYKYSIAVNKYASKWCFQSLFSRAIGLRN